MSMAAAIASAWALLLGIGLIMLGNGLQGTLLGLRATLEGFGATTTGMVMTFYFIGFLGGSTIVPKLMGRVGHIRVFAALASMASTAVLLHAVFVNPIAWAGFRLLTGFCYAGLYIVAESWLNDAATNENRGQLLSVYMVVMLASMSMGQFLLNVADPNGFVLFIVVSALVSFALVPISLTASQAPPFEAPERVSIRALYRTSPLGVSGALLVGMAHSAYYAVGAVYANEVGMSVGQLSTFMAVATLGGMFLQWPIGHLSDRHDRRRVITGVTFVAALAAAGAALFGGRDFAVLLVLTTVFGGMSLPLYSLCIAHTNDFLTREQIVPASSTLVLVCGIGLSMGPTLAGAAMGTFGADGFFGYLAAVHGALGVFALYRMTRRVARPIEEQRDYGPLSTRSTAVASAAIGMESVRDMRDREFARLSSSRRG